MKDEATNLQRAEKPIVPWNSDEHPAMLEVKSGYYVMSENRAWASLFRTCYK